MATLEATRRPAWARYAAGSRIEHFAWYCREFCRHTVGPFAGHPLELEPWQLEFFGEGLAVDEQGLPYWATVVLIVPRKNGKSTSTSAIGTYEADNEDGTPIVGVAATSDEQAGELFGAMDGFISSSPELEDRFHIRAYEGEIARTDGGGFIRRMRMDWRRLHGKNLSKLLADEIHAWSTPNLRLCWEALTTGDGARPDFQTWAITTEGEPDPHGESILSTLVVPNEQFGEVDRSRPGLTISRDHEARVLIYRFSAPMPAADPAPAREAYRRLQEARQSGAPDVPELEDAFEAAITRCVDAAKLANPASWVSRQYLRRKALDPKLSRSAFLRYHCCVAASSEDAWVTGEQWDALAVPGAPDDEGFIPPGARVCIGADGSRTFDTTAVAWAAANQDGTVDVDVRVFSVRQDAPHHVLHDGGTIDYEDVEAFIVDRFAMYRVAEAAYDPRYLDRSADILERRLPSARIAAVEPSSKHQRDALAAFERLVREGKLRHRGNVVTAAHVTAAVAERDRRTDEVQRVRKRVKVQPIDGLMAMVLAVWRASRTTAGSLVPEGMEV